MKKIVIIGIALLSGLLVNETMAGTMVQYYCGTPVVSYKNGVSTLSLPIYHGPTIGSPEDTPPHVFLSWKDMAMWAYRNNFASYISYNDVDYKLDYIMPTKKACPKPSKVIH